MRDEKSDRFFPGSRPKEPGALERKPVAQEMAVRIDETRIDDTFPEIEPSSWREVFLKLAAPAEGDDPPPIDGHGFGLRGRRIERYYASGVDDKIDVTAHGLFQAPFRIPWHRSPPE